MQATGGGAAMVYWVILRPEDEAAGRDGPEAAAAPACPAVERLGPFESRERARTAGVARAERDRRHPSPAPAVRLEIVCDYA